MKEKPIRCDMKVRSPKGRMVRCKEPAAVCTNGVWRCVKCENRRAQIIDAMQAF